MRAPSVHNDQVDSAKPVYAPAQAFDVVQRSRLRKVLVDAANAAERHHVIRGFIELDVTTPRASIRDFASATGEQISLTGYVVSCLAAALSEHRSLQGSIDWRGRLLVPAGIDVAVMVENRGEDSSSAVAMVIRSAERKSPITVSREIRAVQANPLEAVPAVWLRVAGRVPSVVRRLAIRAIARSPVLARRFMGTASVTSLGMFFDGRGWGTAMLHHPLNIVVGGIDKRPDGSERLCVTLEFDHDVVDGAPAARFASDLRDLVEAGHGLPGCDAVVT